MGNRRQKPAEQLQGKGSRYRGTATVTLLPPDAAREIPACPEGLPESLQDAWHAYWADPISQVITSADGYDVGRYFVLLAEREKYERALRRKPTVDGSMGQPVVNPRLAIVKELTREIEKLREQLGILPLARMRLGIATTQHQASVHDLNRKLAQEPARSEPAGVIDLDALG